MKPFGFKQFRDAGYTIPNSDDHLKIVEGTAKDPYDREVPIIDIKYDDKSIIVLYKNSYGGRTISVDATYAKELGLIIDDTQNGYSSILDGLFYKYNRFEPTSPKGKVFKKSFNALYSRSRDVCWFNSVKTIQLLDICMKTIKDNILRDGSITENSEQYIQLFENSLNDLGFHNKIRICKVSGKVNFSTYFTRSIINLRGEIIIRDIDLETYGYKYSKLHNTWMKPDTAVFKNRVYKAAENRKKCQCCLDETPESLMDSDDECVFCAEQAYEIHNYSTRAPSLLKFKASKVKPKEDPLYLGIELEFETTDRNAARLRVGKALRGHAIMKSDGSIRHGFEVVTCPATYDIQLSVFKEFYNNRPPEIQNAPNVGMHIHVSRKPLSVLTIGKLTEFMNRPDNKKFIAFIGGRQLNSYCNQDNRSITYPWIMGNNGARYNALNLTNRDTIEFRIFSTPLTYEDFASRVQFVQALVDYSKPAMQSASLKAQTYYETFINWVNKNRKDYPELTSKLKGFA